MKMPYSLFSEVWFGFAMPMFISAYASVPSVRGTSLLFMKMCDDGLYWPAPPWNSASRFFYDCSLSL